MDREPDETIHILWARSERFTRPQFVAAWTDGLYDAMHEWFCELRDDAIKWYLEEVDPGERGGWTFWMDSERIPRPTEIGEPLEVSRLA